MPPRENDHRLCVLEHVGDQGVRQGGVEKHQGSAGLENAKVRGHDLPVVLRHGHGHDLVRAREEGRKGRGHVFGSRVELSEGQGLPGVRNLQSRETRELLSGAAEDLCEPLDSFLMRYVHQVAVAKDIRQAVLAGVRLPVRRLLRRPKVPPPRHIRQHKEDHEDGCYDDRCQVSSSPGREVRTLGSLTSTADFVLSLSMAKRGAQSKYRWSVPFRRMSKVMQ